MMKKVYGVTQINRYIRNMFAQDFVLHQVCVKGEVSNCKYHSSGHIYFTLKENNSAISAIMFAGNRGGLSFRMQDGDKVEVTGRQISDICKRNYTCRCRGFICQISSIETGT